MASIIDDEIIQRVKEESDIVEWIGRYTKLEKKGRNYMGLCPFHTEKTPSFSVQPEKGYYHCFGCGAGGDVIKFLMEKEGLGFIEAVEKLAEDLHIDLKPSFRDTAADKKRERMVAMNREAALYYMEILSRNPYSLDYLKNRGIGQDMILAFGLGFAPAGGDQLLGHMKAKGYDEKELFEANLLSYNEERNHYYDRFRNRLIFPIIDRKSRVVGFGGRVLDDSLPKYLNSSDTLLYKKSRELYGLNRVMKVSDRERILLVEGYMDVISLHAAGIGYAVASLGTSLTREQARIIKRYGKQVFICYDGDKAGQAATDRAIEVLLAEDIRPRIVVLEGGKDPDEYIRDYGKIAFEGKLNRGLSSVEFQVQNLEKNYHLEDAASLSEFLKGVTGILSKVKSPVERDVFANKFAETYGVRPESFEAEFRRGQASRPKEVKKKPETDRQEGLWLSLLQYGLEDKDFFAIIEKKDQWKYVADENVGRMFTYLSDLYKEDLPAKERKGQFFDAYPEMKERFYRLTKGMDLIHAEAIVSELIDRIYSEGLRLRSQKLLHDIEHMEKSSEGDEHENLSEKLYELNEINRRLHEVEKGTNHR
ncbi:DNA primase [Aedoeadaptatus pacaensis]|uniref:DNA primase n=1 Tax=Aedoeadaptatus pacaensis TaxID=1776390 RepID=UPI000837F089|nr:DNA primase [Peptoniphilus pacaensis]